MEASLSSVLPLGLLSRIHSGSGHLPSAIEFPAAVMFVDVSRYTSLVERLTHRGQPGLEQIPTLLGRSYSRCVDHIYELGGEVLHFAGDALVAYWPGDAGGLAPAVSAAARCAERICDDNEPTDGEAERALHVGVGAGRLWAAALGQQPRCSLLVAGAAVREAAQAQASARKWQFVLSPAARGALGGHAPVPPVTPVTADLSRQPQAEWLRGFLPAGLRGVMVDAEFDHGAGAPLHLESLLAEDRPITVMFARIAGLEHDDPDALARHQLLHSALRATMGRHGGPEGELVFDDKGLVFLAVFGAPRHSHSDDAARAVAAAAAVGPAIEEQGLSASMGVATGLASFRLLGGTRRRQLMVVGAPMNRAARLMTAAKNGVLCDDATRRACRGRFEFTGGPSLQLEGLSDRAGTFLPLREVTAPAARPPLLGRRGELQILTRALDEARAGHHRLVAVLGEPGIGKSHLVDTFAQEVRQRGIAAAVARAERGDEQALLLPWRRVLAAMLDQPVKGAGRDLLRVLSERFAADESVSGRLPLLGDAVGLEGNQTDATRHLVGPNRADATMRLVGDLVAALAAGPLVIVLEDTQWLDSASWRLVEWVVSSVPSLLVVLCLRAGEAPEEFKQLRTRMDPTRVSAADDRDDHPAHLWRVIELEDLDEGHIRALVARTLGDVAPESNLGRRISELAGGNPLFAEEVALTLKSEGLIAVRDGAWRPIRSLDGLRSFDGVERVIRERIDRLHPAAAQVLRAAAVIGRSFTVEAAQKVLEDQVARDRLELAMDALKVAALVRPGESPGDYEFRHDQTRDVVYASLPGAARQRMHGALAEWLESSHSVTVKANIATLLRHFQAAGHEKKVVMYAGLAADRAMQAGAYREAQSFVDICLKNEPPEPWTRQQRLEAVRRRRQLGETFYNRGDLAAQTQAVRRALTMAGVPVPASSVALTRRLAGAVLQLVWRQLSRIAGRRTAGHPRSSWERELARCLNQAAVIDYFELHLTRAFFHAISAVNHALRAGVSREQVAALAQFACALGISGQKRAAGLFMRQADRAAEELGDTASKALVCQVDALWRIGYGQWEAVDERLDHSQELSLQANDHLTWCNAQAVRFWALHYRGDRVRLETTAASLLSRAQNSGNLQQEIWALRCKSLCLIHAERPHEAVEILRLITTTTPASADLAEQIASKGNLALALMRAGEHRESVQVAVETLKLMREMRRPTVHSTFTGVAGVTEVFVRGREAGLARDYDRWRTWERQSLRELDRYRRAFPVGESRYALWSGVADWLNGRRRRAIATLRRGLAQARRMSLKQDEAMIAAELRRRE